MSFMNTFRHTVDKKGRVFIPSKLREELGENFVVSVPLDGQPCLSVYPAQNWDALQEKSFPVDFIFGGDYDSKV